MTSPLPPPRTVSRFLTWRAAHEPERVAIEVHGDNRLTLARWNGGAAEVAAGLRSRGVQPGDRVGLVFGAGQWIDFAVAYCGVQRAGAVAVPLSDRLPPPQVEYALGQCAAVGVIVATPMVSGCGWVASVAELRSGGRTGDTEDASRPSGLAQILYTSGTTGRPKGVAATHANLCAVAPAHPRRLRLAHSRRFAHAFAIGTNAAQTMLLTALFARPGAVSLPAFTPGRFARLLETGDIGTVFLVPSVAIELLNSGALDGRDLSHVHLVGSTAAPLPGAVAVRLSAAFPAATIVNYYTSTEAAPAEASMIFDPARPDAVGRSVGATLRVADARGGEVAPGEVGEIWLRNPFPRHYFGDAAATETTFRGEWVRMGDVGWLDAGGYLHLVDRREDVVKSGAFKVSTVEVEAALHEHPQVAEAAVVGLPHPVLGSVLGAVVVPRPGTPSGEPGVATLRRFLTSRLADYQVPTTVILRDHLDRNEGGKVLKRQLVTLFEAAADPEPADLVPANPVPANPERTVRG